MSKSRKGIGGPKTAQGKLKSSLNALKHGLNAVSPQACEAIAAQYNDDFDQIHTKMRDYYKPTDPLEDEMVKRIARCLSRLDHSAEAEKHLIRKKGEICPPGASFRAIVRYERTVDIHLHRALVALERKRSTPNRNN